MNDVEIPDLATTWANLLVKLQTVGFELVLNVTAGVAIFLIGRALVGMVDKGLRRVMQARGPGSALDIIVKNGTDVPPRVNSLAQ